MVQGALMSRRSTPQRKIDDTAFPVRVKFKVPPLGFGGKLDEIGYWLNNNLEREEFAMHSCSATCADALAIYFRDTVTADRFVRAFPDVELADGTRSIAYTRNGLPLARNRA